MPFGLRTPPSGVAPTYRCEVCGEEVSPRAKAVATRVVGWVTPRTKGGANHIRNQQATGEYAHLACLDEMTDPGHGDQSTLF